MAVGPIDGQILLLTAAKASVPSNRLPELVREAQAELGPQLETYRRRYECVVETTIAGSEAGSPADASGDETERPVYGFLVDPGHWESMGEDLGFDRRAADAVKRAHEEQLRRLARRQDREAELETALEIREAVLIADTDR